MISLERPVLRQMGATSKGVGIKDNSSILVTVVRSISILEEVEEIRLFQNTESIYGLHFCLTELIHSLNLCITILSLILNASMLSSEFIVGVNWYHSYNTWLILDTQNSCSAFKLE